MHLHRSTFSCVLLFFLKFLTAAGSFQHSKTSAKVSKVRSPREGEGSEGAAQAPGSSSALWEPALLTIVGHISVPFLQHQVDPASSSPDLFHSLTVGHPRCALSVDLHQLVGHLKEETFQDIRAALHGEVGLWVRVRARQPRAAPHVPQLVPHTVALLHDPGGSRFSSGESGIHHHFSSSDLAVATNQIS